MKEKLLKIIKFFLYVKPNIILFIPVNISHDITANFLEIYDYLNENYPQEYKFYFYSINKNYKQKENIIRIKNKILFYFIYFSAKFILSEGYSSNIEPQKESFSYIIWHGGGVFKKFGLDNLNNEQKMKAIQKGINKYTDNLFISSGNIKKQYSSALNIRVDKIINLGLPRNDIFFDKTRIEKISKDLKNKYPNFKNKEIILYAPTFRETDIVDGKIYALIDLDLEEISKNLKNQVLLIKLHPNVAAQLKGKELPKNIFDFSEKEEIQTLLIASDLLITDYSSLIFDFAILKRPIIFFVPDLNKYLKTRGFYYEYNKFVPGPICFTTEEVIRQINLKTYNLKRIEKFAKRFNNPFEGNATQMFVENYIIKK